MAEAPFESIESAHEYVALLAQQVEEARQGLASDIAAGRHGSRRIDAFRLVEYKLHQLEEQLARSQRILNDLRTLRRLLLAERESHPSLDDAHAPAARAAAAP